MFTNYVNGTYTLQVQAYEVRHATEEQAIMLRDMINATDKKDKTEELNRFKEEDRKVSKERRHCWIWSMSSAWIRQGRRCLIR